MSELSDFVRKIEAKLAELLASLRLAHSNGDVIAIGAGIADLEKFHGEVSGSLPAAEPTSTVEPTQAAAEQTQSADQAAEERPAG